MNNILFKQSLKENKNHLIDKLNLTPNQKEELKGFFAKHSSYESKVDWNNKSLSYKDFESLLALDGKSKTQAKKYGLVGLVEDKDYVDFGEAFIEEFGYCHLYQPLSYKGSVVLASNKVPPAKGNGAKWCISYQKTDEYWRDYTKKGIKFLFVFTGGTKYALTIYPESLHYENEVYTFEDEKIGWPDWCESSEIVECISKLREIPGPSLAELLDKYEGTLIKNPDGTIDKISYEKVDLSDFIKNGYFICRFNKWEGTFDCSRSNLVSLEGVPEKVEGDFKCNSNNLTSLEGAPIEVGVSFYCHSNHLTSLAGAPREVGGSFDCSHNKLISLEGSPRVVRESFYCNDNNLTSLKGAPIKVRGNFDCSYSNLTSLEGGPEEVIENYECGYNKLISLIGAPKKIGGWFYCNNNQLSSFEEGPEYIGGGVMCCSNPKLGTISSTKGIPSYIGKYMICSLRFKRALERIGAPFEIRVY